MAVNNKIYVFHIRKTDGRGIFLHPFEEFDKIIAKGGTFQIEGRYGEEPVIESLTAFRNVLYRIVEESVNNWITESRFIPRFIISAAVFLFVYFFLSFVIRDPLPMIDEIAAGIGAAVLSYFLLGTKYKKTGKASSLRAHYRGIIDRIIFVESSFALSLEAVLRKMAGTDLEKMSLEVKESDEFSSLMAEEYTDERGQLLSYIETAIKKQLNPRQKKLINKIAVNGLDRSVNLLKELDLIEITGEIDIYLLMVYLSMRQVRFQQPVSE